jgi:PIN domain nuclease of toxin-antitoxin system
MPTSAKELVGQALAGDLDVLVPAMALLEIGYLSEKGKISCTLEEAIRLVSEHARFSVVEISSDIIISAFAIDDIPELHDRVIAGSARYHKATLLTSDAVIRASNHVDVVWE